MARRLNKSSSLLLRDARDAVADQVKMDQEPAIDAPPFSARYEDTIVRMKQELASKKILQAVLDGRLDVFGVRFKITSTLVV